jgi:hypothetical protein
MVKMRCFLMSQLGFPIILQHLMVLVFLWMITQHGLVKGVNGLITCGAIGVTLMSRLFFM